MVVLSTRVVAVLFLLLIAFTADSLFWRRRRRTPPPTPPPPINCVVGNWGDWASCDVTCGLGNKKRTRSKTVVEKNGGICTDALSQTQTCYSGRCCSVNCVPSEWTSWSACSGCGKSTQHRNRTIITKDACGGTPCPHLLETQTCDTGVCCPAGCQLGNWGQWSPCTGSCGGSGTRTRQEVIQYPAKCGGKDCSAVKKESETCTMPCCPLDCQVSDWGDWSVCSTTCGTGFQIRKRSVTTMESCNGQSCPQLLESQSCVINTQQDCKVGPWSSFGPCQPNDGVCGLGKKWRTRTITVSPLCGGATCLTLSESQDSNCGCCPSNCVMSDWGKWSTCSATCGSGIQSRSRAVTVAASCGGTCDSLQETRSCVSATPISCVVDTWSAWSACSNVCGKGTQARSRTVTTSATCGGSCYSLSDTQDCEDYSSNQDCTVSWGQWGSCSSKCSVGTSVRTATVSKPKICNGKNCPTLTKTQSCGQVNGGCAHVCTDGACSCHTGYSLSGTTCTARSCGTPSSKYCPSGTTYNTDCLYPSYACSGTTFQSTCTVSCKSGYELKNGPTVILCQASEAWTPHSTIYCSRINQPPSSITLSNDSFFENTPSGSVVGTLSTSDPNPSDTHTYDLLENAGGKFALKGSSVIVSFVADYETPPTKYEIKVRSKDPKGLYVDKKFTITVKNVNEAPISITPSVFSIDENCAKGTEVGTLTTTDPETKQTHTYQLINSADSRFILDGNKLKVAVDNSKCLAVGGSSCLLNYETASSYQVVVRSMDNGTPAKSADFTLTVKLLDINDKPRLLALRNYTVNETAGPGTIIGTLSVSDEDSGQSITYKLSSNPGNLFNIKGSSLVTASSSIDYEASTSHKVTVVASDSGKPQLSVSASFTIEVVAVNKAPVNITVTDSGGQLTFPNNNPRILENSVKNTVVGTVVVYDQDANEQLTLMLDDDAGKRFALSTTHPRCVAFQGSSAKTKCEASLLVIANLNFEQDVVHTVVVRTTDRNGLFKTARYQITVVNANDPPRNVTFIGGQPSVKENLNDAIIGEFKTGDEDAGDKHTYSLVSSASGRFTISGSRLMTSATANLNFETATQYKIVVRSTDSGGRSLDQTFTVMVEDVNEAPTAVKLTFSKVPENSAAGTVVGTLQPVDPDNVKTNRQSFTYVLLDGAQSRFKIDKNVVKVAADQTLCLKHGGANCKLNYESRRSHNITVQITDNGNPPLSKTFNITVTITDANDPPNGLSIDKFKVNESAPAGTLIGTLSASDEDISQSLTYTIISTGGLFKIKGNQLFKSQSIDYETAKAHVITVKVSDSGSPQLSMSKNITIEVLNTNEAPFSLTLKDTDGLRKFNRDFPVVNETWPIGTVVGTVEVSDPDNRDTVTFSLEKNGNGRFSLRQSTANCKPVTLQGVKTICSVQVVVAGNLDYESFSQHVVIVKATDYGGLATSKQFIVKVADVNEPPTDITIAGGVVQVEENKSGATVGTLVTSDPDTQQTFRYTIMDKPAGPFEIVGNLLKVTKTGNIDYESQWSYTLTIKSTDSGHPSQSLTKKIVVRVLDVNEAPTDVFLTPQQVPENEGTGTRVGVLTAVDPEHAQSHSYTLLDDADGRFTINGSSVEVSPSNASCVKVGGNSCLLNYEAKRWHRIRVRCTDDGNPPQFKDKTFNITVQNRNDPPRSITVNPNTIQENIPRGSVVATFTATDEDADQSLSYSIGGADKTKFTVERNQLKIQEIPDYETKPAYVLTVTVKDGGNPNLVATQTFVLAVVDKNERPFNLTFTDLNGQQSFSIGKPVVNENTHMSATVGTVIVYDVDKGDKVSIKLDDDAGGLFQLTGQTNCAQTTSSGCSVSVSVNGPLDFESAQSHDIVIRATDLSNSSTVAVFTIKVLNVNEKPTDISLAGGNVSENSGIALVGELLTTDPDFGQSYVYNIISTTGPFVLKGSEVWTSGNPNLDFEKAAQHTITVKSTDNGAGHLSVTKSLKITVVDVNEYPSGLSLNSNTVPENSGEGVVIGNFVTVDPDFNETHSYTLVYNPDHLFRIRKGQLQVNVPNTSCLRHGGKECKLNFERAKSHNITVRVTDSGQLEKDFVITVQVKDENDKPRHLTLSKYTVLEHKPSNKVIANLSASDEDEHTVLTYTLDDSDNGIFAVSSNKLTIDSTIDYEKQKIHHVTVRVTDNGSPSMSITKTFAIQVLNVNEKPVKVTVVSCGIRCETYSDGHPRVNESSVVVGIVEAHDPDYNQSMTFNLTDDGDGLFRISPSVKCLASKLKDTKTVCYATLQVAGKLDYETATHHDIAIKATDRLGHFIENKFTVTVLDVNEAPTLIQLGNGAAQVPENKKSGTIVGILTVTDADNGQKHDFSISDPSGSFLVSGNVVKVSPKAILNYEVISTYPVWITVTDRGRPPLSLTSKILIEVEDVNEPPTGVSPRTLQVSENSAANTTLGTLIVTDPDNKQKNVQTFSFVLADSANGRFKIENGTVKVRPSNERCLKFGGDNCLLNYEAMKSHTIRVRVTDSGTPPESAEFSIAISVMKENDRPRNLQISNQEVNENSAVGHVVGVFTATDEDNDHLFYEMVGDINGVFVVKQSQLIVNKPLNHEQQKTYNIRVKVTDNGSLPLSSTESFVIEVVNENEPPVSVTFLDSNGQMSFSVNSPVVKENSAIGTAVGTIEARDPDEEETITFSLIDNANGSFKISTLSQGSCNSVSGTQGIRTACQVQLLVSGKLNYELKSRHDIIVSVTDSGRRSYVARFTVIVLDVNEKPTNISVAGGNPKVNENSNNALVGELLTTDPDFGQSHVYNISNTRGLFVLKGNEVWTSETANLDFEKAAQHTITVLSTDDGAGRLSDTQSLQITVLDVNEAPSGLSLSSDTVPENSGEGVVIGNFVTADPDFNETHSYTLVYNPDDLFRIRKGQLQVNVPNTSCLRHGGKECKLNFERAKSHNITVRVTDSGQLQKDFVVTVQVKDENDKPRHLTLSKYTVLEYELQPSNTMRVIATLSASDEDEPTVLNYTLVDNDNGMFAVSNNKLTIDSTIDYEKQKIHHVTVRVTDNGSPSMSITKTFAIQVLNVNEKPVKVTVVSCGIRCETYSDGHPRVNESSVVVGIVEAHDPDYNQSMTFNLTDDGDGLFRISPSVKCVASKLKDTKTVCYATLQVAGKLDYETATHHDIAIKATDRLGHFIEDKFTVTVLDVNEAPTLIQLGNGAARVPENKKSGTIVGILTVTDADNGQKHDFSISDPSGSFLVSGNVVKVSPKAILNYEVISTYPVWITVTDRGRPPLSLTSKILIEVEDVNEPPTGVSPRRLKVSENSAANTTLGTLIVTDPDNNQSFSFKLANSANGRFKIENGIVKVRPSNKRCLEVGGENCLIDYESEKLHTIWVQVTDNGTPPESTQFSIAIDVTNANDRPRNLRISNQKVNENSAIGHVIGVFTATDEDSDQLFYELVGDINGVFVVKQSQLIVNKPLNYEQQKTYNIRVEVTDSGVPSLSLSESFVIEVVNEFEPPVSMTFLDSNGQLQFSVNFPVVEENSVIGTTVGTIEARDPDIGETMVFSLINNPNGLFSLSTPSQSSCNNISGIPGIKTACQVQLLVSGKLNYELKSQHDIAVSVNDSGGKIHVTSFTIGVQDINDAPTDLQLAGGHPVVTENRQAAVIGELVTTDEDRNQKFTYFLVSDGGGPFVIVNREVRLKNRSSVDYETNTRFTIRVISKDNGSPPRSFEKTITVQVIDVNEAPTSVSLSTYKVAENSGSPTQVGFLSTTDPDNAKHHRQNHTYHLVDDAGGRFEIVNGAVRVKGSNVQCLKSGGDSCLLNYEKGKSHRIVVEVKDNGNPPLKKEFQLTILVKNTNDRPRNLTVSNLLINENLPKGTLIGTVSAFDEDTSDTLSYSIIDADGGNFNLNGNRLYSGRSENFETRSSYIIKLQVVDDGSPKMTMDKLFTVTVIDVNEQPSSVSVQSDGGQLNFTTDFPQVNEDARPGTAVGTVEVLDVDTYNGEGMVIALDDSDGGRFRMATGAGVTCGSTTLPGYKSVCRAKIYVAKPLDYETDVDHTIIVRATDKGGRGLFKAVKFTVFVVNVNDPPTDIDLVNGNPRVKENVNGAVVGELVVTDQDSLQTHKCELLDSASSRFVIVNREVRVSTTANLDYETHNRHTIRVKCTDNGTPALSVTKSFTVDVLDVNEKPTKIHISNDQIEENARIFTVVGKLTASDPDNSHNIVQTFTYKLLDSAGDRFRIDGDIVKVAISNTKCLALGGKWCALNLEEKNRCDIVVRVTDNGSPPLSIDNTITIDLTDINDRPRNLDLSSNIVYENARSETVVGRFSASDEDTQQRLEYVLIDSEDGKFEIVGDQLRKALSADYETANSHSVRVTVRDNGHQSLNISRRFVIEVKDVNEAPFNVSIVDDARGDLDFVTNKPRVRENAVIDTTVGIVEILDYDNNDTVFFLLDDDSNGAFKLDAGVTCNNFINVTTVNTRCFTTLLVARHLNFETTDSHYVSIRAVDKSGLFAVSRFKVEIVDINDVPGNIELSRTVVNENLDDYLVGCFSTVDEDLTHNHTHTLSDDARGRFVVKGHCLYTSLNASLNYEKQTEINVTVRSTDDGVPPLFREETYLITVLDVNENPSNIAVSNLKIEENSPTDSVVGVVSADDPDNHGPKGPWQSHQCTVIDDSQGRFVVKGNILKVAVSDLDYEMNATLDIVIRCTDSGTPPLYRDQLFTIFIKNVNEKPTKIVVQGGVSPENRQEHVVASFFTVDPDDESVVTENFTYRLLNSGDALPFAMLGNQLVNTRMLNYEANPTWRITVVSTDHGGLSITETFQVNVTDVNDVPSGIILAGSAGVPENTVAGTFVGSVYTVDQDTNQTHTYRLLTVEESSTNSTISISQSPFSLDAQTGVLTVSRSADLDYEKISLYTLQIVTTDSGTPSYNYTGYVKVRITNVNEQPTNISLNGSEVTENSPNGTVVGTLFVSDPDNANGYVQWHTCIILRPYRTPFQVIDNVTLTIAEVTLDYEQAEFHDITIRCSDSGTPLLHIDRSFTIRVRDVNEAPADVSFIRPQVGENLPPGSLAGVATCRDPDNEVNPNRSSVVFVLESDGPFILNGSDLLTTETLDYENRSSYTVTLTAVDNGVPPLNTTVTIVVSVLDMNDPPLSIRFYSNGVLENSPINTIVGNLSTDDEDCCQDYYYSLLRVNATTNLFRVVNNQLILDENDGLDFEGTQIYTMVIRSTDSGNPRISVEGVITVYVLDVNEPPTDIISYTVSTIAENAAAGTFVANLTVIDPDFNQTHRCELLNGSEYFSIVQGNIPELLVVRGAQIDYEQNANIWVNIRCTDDGNPPISVDHSFHVTVTDINEPPTEIIYSGKRAIPENKPVGVVIGNLGVVDQDIGQSHSYKVVGQWASAFKVVKRQLSVADSVPFDFDLLRVKIINVTISVSDDGTPSYTYNQTFSFNITGVNEPPVHIQITGGGWIYENGSIGDEVGRLFCDNPERNEVVVYDIRNINGYNNSKEFYIIGTTLYLNTTLQYENVSTYELVIRALDDGIPPLQSEETVSVTVKATDPCALHTSGCHGNATCSRLGPDNAVCHCRAGFAGNGIDCYDVPECEVTRPDVTFIGDANSLATLCGNGGTCVDGIGNYTCLCPVGWTGRGCRQDIIECFSNPCIQGYCSENIGRYSCSCYDGFTGVNCETNMDDCADFPCGPGTCVDGADDFTCLCPNSYEGYRCSFPVDVCRDNPCELGLTCVPRPVNPRGMTGFLAVNQTSKPYCVPPYYVSGILIRGGSSDDDHELNNEFAQFVENNLYVIPSSHPYSHGLFQSVRISSVYIVNSEPVENDLFVHFVVIIDNNGENEDTPVLSNYDVLVGLNNSCWRGAIGKHSHMFCDGIESPTLVTPPVPGDPRDLVSDPDESPGNFLWPVIGCLLLIAVVVGGGLILLGRARKKQLRRRARMDDETRSMLPAAELDHGGLMVTSPIYDGSAGLFVYNDKRKDNPLYYDSDDEEGVDYEYDDPNCFSGMSNPLFSEEQPELVHGVTYSNPLFAATTDGETPEIRQNPLYEEASAVNPIYERTENIYDQPEFCNEGN